MQVRPLSLSLYLSLHNSKAIIEARRETIREWNVFARALS